MSESEHWIIVSFDGGRGIVYGRRGKREVGPAKALGTIAIPLDAIRDQIEAAGYTLHVPAPSSEKVGV